MNTELGNFVSATELATALGIARSGIFNLVKAGKFPQGIKIGACRRWNIDDVNKWLDSQNQAINQEAI